MLILVFPRPQTFSGDEEAKVVDPGNKLAKVAYNLGLDKADFEFALTTSSNITKGT